MDLNYDKKVGKMNYIQLVLIAIGLAMDAFAAAISKGLCLSQIKHSNAFVIAMFFGVFQAVMFFLGWLLAKSFASYISAIDHWLAFFILSFIGGKIIIETIKSKNIECCSTNTLDIKNVFYLAIATSLDALAVGVTFAIFPEVNIYISMIIVGFVTFVLSFIGVFIGHFFGLKYKKISEILGGLILILIGVKILLEGLSIYFV